jgi:hypothetical protein
MIETIQLPADLAQFDLPAAVNQRLQNLLDRQDSGRVKRFLMITFSSNPSN